jgi:hypothetical protein
MASAMSEGLCEESAVLEAPELEAPVNEPTWSLLQLERTSATAANKRSEATSRTSDLCFFAMGDSS